MIKRIISLIVICTTTNLNYGQTDSATFVKTPKIDIDILGSNTIGQKVKLNSQIQKTNFSKIEKIDGQGIWQYRIWASEAEGMVVFFDKLYLGENTQIRAFSPNCETTTRYFSKNNNSKTGTFALPYVIGSDVIIEVKCNSQVAFEQLEIEMTEIGIIHSFYGFTDNMARDFGDAPNCFANVNCSEGTSWQDQKRSVAKYMTVNGANIGFCTGSLINNTGQDCKDYFLSAQHCAIGASVGDLGQFVFYFNYESTDCTSPATDNGLNQETVIGCTKLAESGSSTTLPPDNSDFMLFELTSIPSTYNVYYSGWDRSPIDQIQGNGSIIQHPQGDIKKISFWDVVSTSFTSTSHMEVDCIPSTNGDGIVEPISSGSPIYDANKNIIGNITAGTSGCIFNAGGNAFAVGGSFRIHWDQCGTTNDRQLKPWIDPINLGVMSLSGKNQCNSSVGINELAENNLIHIYPNPASKIVTVDATSPIERIDVYSILGILLMSVNNLTQIDISTLPNGPTFIHVLTSNSDSIIKQLVIQK